MTSEQTTKIQTGNGFIAALDQSGGSTPKALRLYGVEEGAYNGDAEMFDKVHEMRTRIVTSPAFTGEKVIGAILFEMTMDREFAGKPAATYLWEDKGVVPFLKVDKGLADEDGGVQVMKPIPNLDELLKRAADKGIFGTKMRSVVKSANGVGIKTVVAQQFDIGKQIIDAGLMPIIEPEVDINAADKAECETMLKAEILAQLDALEDGKQVMLKLTLPSVDGFYDELVAHDKVLKVVALSGGYTRDDANKKLAQNKGIIASFSRALTEGLNAGQSDDEFNTMLGNSIDSIHAASIA